MRRISVGILALLLAGFAADARAASTASVQGTTIVVTGDGGANDIVFDGGYANADDPYSSTLRDTTGLTAGAGCRAIDDQRAYCGDGSSVTAIEITTGDGADRIGLPNLAGAFLVLRTVTIDAGAGNDVLSLGATTTGPDNELRPLLRGGPGDDRIVAGGDSATVEGGEGADVLDGTGGNDTLRGGAGDDQVNGNPGNDRLFGDAGNDTITGGGGDDELEGGSGQDKLSGDAGNTMNQGNDTIRAVDGERDSVSCDFGADVAYVDAIDIVESGQCETVERGGSGPGPGTGGTPTVGASAPATVTPTRLLSRGVPVRVSADEPVGAAVGLFVDAATARRLGVGRAQTVLGQASGNLSAQRTFVVRVKARYRRAVARARGFTLRVLIVAQDARGNKVQGVRTVRVRR